MTYAEKEGDTGPDVRKCRTLYLFTETFPYGPGESFLETELPYLAAEFPRTVIVPATAPGRSRSVPVGVEVCLSLARSRGPRMTEAWRGFLEFARLQGGLWELMENRGAMRYASAWRRMLQTLSRAGAARDWLLRIAESECHPENVVYTYWLGGETLGAVLANTRRRPMRVVSRAHGHDLYEERHDPPYLPFRNAIFRGVTAVYPVSEDGAKVLQARWPGWADRIRMARLGVADPSHDTPPSHDGVLRVVSCSFLVPVKRVELLVTALACLGAQDPALRVEWTHLGDGPLSDAIQRLAENSFTPNIGARFLGHLEHREVLDYFRSNPVDVFVNVSSSEGVPVSIMEAQSFGIPVVATAVGGTPEIVSDTNGILLPKNAEVEEVARAIGAFRDTGETVLVRRRKSKEMWRERYDADRNFPNFARRLTEAASAGPIRLALAEGER